jgi:hypothetical protein
VVNGMRARPAASGVREPSGRCLVGCAVVGPPGSRGARQRLDHHPLRRADRPQPLELGLRQRTGVGVGEQAGLLEHQPGDVGEVADRGVVSVGAQPVGRVGIPGLRTLPEGEQRFVATELGPAPCDLEHGLGGEVRRRGGRRLGERAVAATVRHSIVNGMNTLGENVMRVPNAVSRRRAASARRSSRGRCSSEECSTSRTSCDTSGSPTHDLPLDELYASAPADFFATRAELVRRLREAGDTVPAACSAVGRHKRPTPSTSWPGANPTPWLRISISRPHPHHTVAPRDENARGTARSRSRAPQPARCAAGSRRNTAMRSSAAGGRFHRSRVADAAPGDSNASPPVVATFGDARRGCPMFADQVATLRAKPSGGDPEAHALRAERGGGARRRRSGPPRCTGAGPPRARKRRARRRTRTRTPAGGTRATSATQDDQGGGFVDDPQDVVAANLLPGGPRRLRCCIGSFSAPPTVKTMSGDRAIPGM